MCLELNEISQTENEVEEILNRYKQQMLTVKSTQKKARYYSSLKQLKDWIESEMEKYKLVLIDEKVEEYFEDEDIKVVYQEGSRQSEINVQELFNELRDERIHDFVKVCSVSESNLKKLYDGEALISRYKYDLGTTKSPSIKVSRLSKEDKKRLLEKSFK